MLKRTYEQIEICNRTEFTHKSLYDITLRMLMVLETIQLVFRIVQAGTLMETRQ